MGNRGSISVISRAYKNHFSEKIVKPEESVCLFRHWGGDINGMIQLVNRAFVEMKNGYRTRTEGYPEEIIALLTKISCIELKSSAYLGMNKRDGDNSDNGHFLLEIGEPHNSKLLWKLYNFDYNFKKNDFEEKQFIKQWSVTIL